MFFLISIQEFWEIVEKYFNDFDCLESYYNCDEIERMEKLKKTVRESDVIYANDKVLNYLGGRDCCSRICLDCHKERYDIASAIVEIALLKSSEQGVAQQQQDSITISRILNDKLRYMRDNGIY